MSNLTSSIQISQKSTYHLNNGTQIPVIGFGCYQIPAEKTKNAVYTALKDGYRHIDCAVMYRNEKEAAQGIAEFLKDHPDVHREDIWFTTKIADSEHGYEETKQSVERISQRVKEYIGHVDLVLIHSPLSNREKRLGTWKALQEYVQNPSNPVLHIRSLGVSNYGIFHLEELLNWDGLLVKPVVDQLEFHPWLPRLKLREYLVKNHILAEAYSPLTRGRKFDDPALVEMEKKYKISKADILLKWSFLQGFVVLVKSENPERIKLNLNVLSANEHGKVDLEEEIVTKLDMPDSNEVLTWNGKDLTALQE